ncbi:hypothetical protein J3R30DRAFT_3678984, partial [Lentinula aciculospora]
MDVITSVPHLSSEYVSSNALVLTVMSLAIREAMAQAYLVKYISAASLAVILYDHLLTFDEEVSFFWRDLRIVSFDDWQIHQSIFLVRYFSEAVVAYFAYVQSGKAVNSNDSRCVQFVWVFSISATLIISSTQFSIIWRLFQLWNCKRIVKKSLLIGFTATIVTATTFLIHALLQIQRAAHFVGEPLNSCVFSTLPKAMPAFFTIWPVFDVFLIMVLKCHAALMSKSLTMFFRMAQLFFLEFLVLTNLDILTTIDQLNLQSFALSLLFLVSWVLRSEVRRDTIGKARRGRMEDRPFEISY